MKLHIVFVVMSLLVCDCCLYAQQEPTQKLLKTFDCTQDYPPDTYFGHGDVKIVDSPLGKYREAEGKPLSRFGYRFQVENAGKPHLLVARYPDDKRRFMCMMDGTCYDLTEGVYTDVHQPISGKMLELRHIFWPRSNDHCSVVFMTWSDGEPAAVADVKVYELSELPPMNPPTAVGSTASTPRRSFGIQFEDPCGKGFSCGAMTPQQWQDRMIQYMRYTGQNMLVYPLVWYHGPHYPSDIEPCQEFGSVVAPDRTIYGFWTDKPADWVIPLLGEFEKQGLQFKAAMTLLRLGSLMKDMNIDLASIQAGKETYNNMRSDDKVQDGTQDWTPEYNVLNNIADRQGTRKGWAYGERKDTCSKGPMFNPLHPKVQRAIVNLIDEIGRKYGSSPAFQGVSLNMWHATICWFATQEIGYDDYTTQLFTKETGVEIPVDAAAADRFSKRREFLLKNHRDRWLDWRCAKIHDLFRTMRDSLVKARPNLELTVNLWTETTMSQLFGFPDGPEDQIFARKSTYEIYREGGFDVKLYQNEPGVRIDYVFLPSRDRDDWGYAGVNMKLEQMCMFRDHDFLDDATLSALKTVGATAFVFDSWVEAWGKPKSFPCKPDDPRVADYAKAWSIPPENFAHWTSEYPKDGFWWDWQLRITPHFPAGDHYLEHFAHAVAEFDSLEITRGGLFLDTGHSEEKQLFARTFRVLPAKKFDTVGDSTDPVAVRSLLLNGQQYIYLVNREYYPVKVSLKFDKSPAAAIDLSTNQSVAVASADWTVNLGPYQLLAYTLPPDVKITGFNVEIPDKIELQLAAQTVLTLQRIEQLKSKQIALPEGTDRIVALIGDALAKQHFARLRHALDSYIIRKIDELAEKSSAEPSGR